MSNAVLDIIVRAIDQASSTFNNIEGALDSAENAARTAETAFEQMDKAERKVSNDAKDLERVINQVKSALDDAGSSALTTQERLNLIESAMGKLANASQTTRHGLNAAEEATALMKNALSALEDQSISTKAKMEIIDEAMENIGRAMNKAEGETISFRQTLGETAKQAVDSLTDTGIGFANAFAQLEAGAPKMDAARASFVAYGMSAAVAEAATTLVVQQIGSEVPDAAAAVQSIGRYMRGASDETVAASAVVIAAFEQMGVGADQASEVIGPMMQKYGVDAKVAGQAILDFANQHGLSIDQAMSKIEENPSLIKPWIDDAKKSQPEMQGAIDQLGSGMVSQARSWGTKVGGEFGGYMTQGMLENLPMMLDLVAGTLIAATVQYAGAKIHRS